MTDVYDDLLQIGVPMDNHESDLYVLATDEARSIVKNSGRSHSFFTSQIDGKVWIDVAFAYKPWWESKSKNKGVSQ